VRKVSNGCVNRNRSPAFYDDADIDP